MFHRLLRLVPVILPFAVKFVRSRRVDDKPARSSRR